MRNSTQGTGFDCCPSFRPCTQATEASTGATSPSGMPPGSASLLSHVRPESDVTQAALPVVGGTTAEALFSQPQSAVPEAPVTPLLVVPALIGAALYARRRRGRA